MKRIFTTLTLSITTCIFAQNTEVDLSEIEMCGLTLSQLRQLDNNIKEVKLEEMQLCTDGFLTDNRFVNRIGYETKLYPGVIFQKYQDNDDKIAKLHLNKGFKGRLPDGKFIDLNTLTAKEIFKSYDTLDPWRSRGCSVYWTISKNDKTYFYVKINKNKTPQYPVDEQYYSEQLIQAIDIVADCYVAPSNTKVNLKPLYIFDGKEITEETLYSLEPSQIESIIVLKNEKAIAKYGDKGINGVVEISSKRK